MFVPVQQTVLFRSESIEQRLQFLLFGESGPFGENESVFIGTDGNEEVVFEFLEVIDQQLIGLLHKNYISIALL